MTRCLDEAKLQSYFDGELSIDDDGKRNVASGFMRDLCGGGARAGAGDCFLDDGFGGRI